MKYTLPALFLLFIVACGEQTTSVPTFTISLQPATLTLRVTETGSVKIAVNRSGGFADNVTVTLEGETTGLEVDPLVIAAGEGTLGFRVTDAATIGNSFPSVTAVAGTVTRRETLTLRIERAVATITEVAIQDSLGSSEVRQGFGELDLTVAGGNLERVSAASVGDLKTSIVTQTATRLELRASVPHGATLGPKDLVLTTEGGDMTETGAVVVTPVTSGPAGSDTSGRGTSDSPYRTLTHALSVSQDGDTVKLQDGVYTTAAGEQWPVVSAADEIGPNVAVGVRVEGDSAEGVVLEGPGATATRLTIALAFAGDGAADNLTVRGFAFGFVTRVGNVTLSNVRAEVNGVGLATDGGQTRVEAGEFSANDVGILAVDGAALTLMGGSSFDNSGDGLRLGDGAPRLEGDGFEAYGNQNGISLAGEASAQLRATKLYDNLEHGLKADEGATVEIRSSEFYANAQAGLWFSGTRLTLRGAIIRDNAEFGVYIQGEPTRIDLGTFSEPGDNTLFGNGPNGNGDQLLDARQDLETLGDIVFTVSATRLSGVLPAPDVYVGLYLNAPHFSILGQNQTVQVY